MYKTLRELKTELAYSIHNINFYAVNNIKSDHPYILSYFLVPKEWIYLARMNEK